MHCEVAFVEQIDGIRMFVFQEEDVCEQSIEKDFLGESVCVHQT